MCVSLQEPALKTEQEKPNSLIQTMVKVILNRGFTRGNMGFFGILGAMSD